MLLEVFIVLFILESIHDYSIEKIQNFKETKYVRRWHTVSFVSWIIIAGYCVYLNHGFTWTSLGVLAFLGLLRNFILNTGLNIQRGKDLYYLGSNGIDGYLKKIEKLWWALSLLVIIFVFATVIPDLYTY
jgi:hypothetical protein